MMGEGQGCQGVAEAMRVRKVASQNVSSFYSGLQIAKE